MDGTQNTKEQARGWERAKVIASIIDAISRIAEIICIR
jgi:hypothetical protein